MSTDIETVQLSANIKLEQLTPAALDGLIRAAYNGAFIVSRKTHWCRSEMKSITTPNDELLDCHWFLLELIHSYCTHVQND